MKLSGKRTLILKDSGKFSGAGSNYAMTVSVNTDGANTNVFGVNLSGFRQRRTVS
jgi:hypothetical protein